MHTIVFIVSRQRRELFDALREAFKNDPKVKVVLDQRAGPRRRGGEAAPERERRRYDRRERHVSDTELREHGWTMIQLLV